MNEKKKTTFIANQKAKIALATLQERHPAWEITREHDAHPNRGSQWKRQVLKILQASFSFYAEKL